MIEKSYWKNKTVMVSGGLGFIGSHFVEELALAGANVICLYLTHREIELFKFESSQNIRYIQVDILDRNEIEAACKYAAPKIDCFIHCAALDGNTEYKLKYAAQILDTNNRLVSNILNSCRTTDIKDVVLLSSAEIYSSSAPGKISESDDYHKYLDYTKNGYILSKIFLEILAELHHDQYGMNIYIPRPTNVYGPRDNFKEGNNRVIPSMILKIARGENIETWGDGKQTRSFIYVKDLVQTTLQMIETKKFGVLNVATEEQISILELAHFISDSYGAKNKVTLDKTKPVGVKARPLDVNNMYDLIDFKPCTIRDGLKQTTEWYVASSE